MSSVARVVALAQTQPHRPHRQSPGSATKPRIAAAGLAISSRSPAYRSWSVRRVGVGSLLTRVLATPVSCIMPGKRETSFAGSYFKGCSAGLHYDLVLWTGAPHCCRSWPSTQIPWSCWPRYWVLSVASLAEASCSPKACHRPTVRSGSSRLWSLCMFAALSVDPAHQTLTPSCCRRHLSRGGWAISGSAP